MFTPREIGTLFLGDKAHGQNRRRYYNKDGKKRTCWIKSSRHDAPTRYIKVTRAEPKPKLRGPKDIVLRKRFKKILQGELVDFSFLTPLEKRILTMKALGKKHSQIARALYQVGV